MASVEISNQQMMSFTGEGRIKLNQCTTLNDIIFPIIFPIPTYLWRNSADERQKVKVVSVTWILCNHGWHFEGLKNLSDGRWKTAQKAVLLYAFSFFVFVSLYTTKKTPWMEFGLADREEVCCVTAMVLSEWEIDMNWRSVVLWHASLWCSSLLAPCALPVKTCVVVVCRHSVWSGVSRWFLPSLSSTNLLQAHDVAEVQWGGTHINIQHSFTHTLIKV